jgi:hypothetical protein
MREARDEPAADWIGDGREHDRNRLCLGWRSQRTKPACAVERLS